MGCFEDNLPDENISVKSLKVLLERNDFILSFDSKGRISSTIAFAGNFEKKSFRTKATTNVIEEKIMGMSFSSVFWTTRRHSSKQKEAANDQSNAIGGKKQKKTSKNLI